MEEIFDVYDIDGNLLGQKPKSFCHGPKPGVFHKPVWIWIYNDKKQILSSTVLTQSEHKNFGGVVPELAARAHLDHIDEIIAETFTKADIKPCDIDAVAVAAIRTGRPFEGERADVEPAAVYGDVILIR